MKINKKCVKLPVALVREENRKSSLEEIEKSFVEKIGHNYVD